MNKKTDPVLPLKFDFGDIVYIVNIKDNICEIVKGIVVKIAASCEGVIQQVVEYTYTVQVRSGDYKSFTPDQLLTAKEMIQKVKEFYKQQLSCCDFYEEDQM